MRCTLWAEGKPCYLCLVTMHGKESFKGHRGYRVPRSVSNGGRAMALTKPAGTAAGDRSSGPLAGGDAATLFPTVWEWLSGDKWDDGSPRETSTCLFFVESGMCKACFNDRAGQRKCWATGVSPEACFLALESMLVSGQADWRSDNGKTVRGRK